MLSFSVGWFGLYAFSTREHHKVSFSKKSTELSVCLDSTGNKSTLPCPSGAVGLVELSVLSQILTLPESMQSLFLCKPAGMPFWTIATIHSLSVFQFTKSHSASYSHLSLENQGINFFLSLRLFLWRAEFQQLVFHTPGNTEQIKETK